MINSKGRGGSRGRTRKRTNAATVISSVYHIRERSFIVRNLGLNLKFYMRLALLFAVSFCIFSLADSLLHFIRVLLFNCSSVKNVLLFLLLDSPCEIMRVLRYAMLIRCHRFFRDR